VVLSFILSISSSAVRFTLRGHPGGAPVPTLAEVQVLLPVPEQLAHWAWAAPAGCAQSTAAKIAGRIDRVIVIEEFPLVWIRLGFSRCAAPLPGQGVWSFRVFDLKSAFKMKITPPFCMSSVFAKFFQEAAEFTEY